MGQIETLMGRWVRYISHHEAASPAAAHVIMLIMQPRSCDSSDYHAIVWQCLNSTQKVGECHVMIDSACTWIVILYVPGDFFLSQQIYSQCYYHCAFLSLTAGAALVQVAEVYNHCAFL